MLTWPDWPLKLRTSSSHQEGAERDFSVLAKRAIGEDGKVVALECVRVEWVKDAAGRMAMQEIEGSAFLLKADLTAEERDYLERTRRFVHDEVLPQINDFWERAEVPLDLCRRLGELGAVELHQGAVPPRHARRRQRQRRPRADARDVHRA